MANTEALRIDSDDLSVEALFKDFYSVPDFQREYVWKQEHVEKLLNDLNDEFYDEGGNVVSGPEYFLGSVVVFKADDGTFQLIDGQQRMTTLYLILCVIRDLFQELKSTPGEVLKGQIASASIDARTGDEIYKERLTLQYPDSDGVMECIVEAREQVDAIPETTASVRNILAAYQAIKEFLRVNLDSDPKRLRQFHAQLTKRVKLIRIVTPSLTNALKVFETVNARGVGLNAMDLLKNLLFIKLESGDYARLKRCWKSLVDTLDYCGEKPLRFLRYYIMSHFEIDYQKGLREDQIYEWFVRNASSCGIESDPLGFAEELVDRASAYANHINGKDANGSPISYLENISALSGAARQHLILALAARNLPPDLFAELCRHVENLFFCYIITREPTKTFERNFAKWSRELRKVKDVQGLRAFVTRYFEPDKRNRSGDFDFAFAELEESRLQKYRLRYVLAKLTQFIEEQAWGNPAHARLAQYLDKTVHIEHVLPQNPAPGVKEGFDKPDSYFDYVGKLGNLTLLEQTINSSVSNDAYKVKRAGFRQSAFLLTKSMVEKPKIGVNTQLNRAVAGLLQFDVWSSATVESRQEMLGGLARRVWDMPSKGKAGVTGSSGKEK